MKGNELVIELLNALHHLELAREWHPEQANDDEKDYMAFLVRTKNRLVDELGELEANAIKGDQ